MQQQTGVKTIILRLV